MNDNHDAKRRGGDGTGRTDGRRAPFAGHKSPFVSRNDASLRLGVLPTEMMAFAVEHGLTVHFTPAGFNVWFVRDEIEKLIEKLAAARACEKQGRKKKSPCKSEELRHGDNVCRDRSYRRISQ